MVGSACSKFDKKLIPGFVRISIPQNCLIWCSPDASGHPRSAPETIQVVPEHFLGALGCPRRVPGPIFGRFCVPRGFTRDRFRVAFRVDLRSDFRIDFASELASKGHTSRLSGRFGKRDETSIPDKDNCEAKSRQDVDRQQTPNGQDDVSIHSKSQRFHTAFVPRTQDDVSMHSKLPTLPASATHRLWPRTG